MVINFHLNLLQADPTLFERINDIFSLKQYMDLTTLLNRNGLAYLYFINVILILFFYFFRSIFKCREINYKLSNCFWEFITLTECDKYFLFEQGGDGSVFFFDVQSGFAPIGFIKTPSAVTCLDWSPKHFVSIFQSSIIANKNEFRYNVCFLVCDNLNVMWQFA